MNRKLDSLIEIQHDLLVIGGGIYGACIARDAALRGLSVALVEKGDFGAATSANSLKILHGGLRYLPDANLGLMRAMIRERSTWIRVAPHLVHPLPFLMPTTKKISRSKLILSAALLVNDLISCDRNHSLEGDRCLPAGQIISQEACLEILPGLSNANITGGAIWYDAQIHNSERLLLSLLLSAQEKGARIANYVSATNFLGDERDVYGVEAKDMLTDRSLLIQARVVVNCAGAWVDSLLAKLNGRVAKPTFNPSVALNLVTRQIFDHYAVGLSNDYSRLDGTGNLLGRSRSLFIVPWHNYSLIGTWHLPYEGDPEEFQLKKSYIQDFIGEINSAYPPARLNPDDIYHVHWGFLPMVMEDTPRESVKLVRQSAIHDHERTDGIAGLITVVGVKYTTARDLAQKVIDLVCQKLAFQAKPCRTSTMPVYGGDIGRVDEFQEKAIVHRPSQISPDIIRHLVFTYGSTYRQILDYLDENPYWGQTVCDGFPILKAEVVHAVRKEMAVKLGDVVNRRTEAGAVGLPAEGFILVCADIMAEELGWDEVHKEGEIKELLQTYYPFKESEMETFSDN